MVQAPLDRHHDARPIAHDRLDIREVEIDEAFFDNQVGDADDA
jgi:hypothetical protein